MPTQIDLTAADSHSIPALHFKFGAPSLLIASHGITTEKTEEGIYTRFAEQILPPEFDTLLFDFRGHGDSALPSSEVTVAGEILDFMAIVQWAQNQNYRRICHLGTSFGASITLLAASVYDLNFFSRVVFWNPVISFWNTFIEAQVEWGREYFDQANLIDLSNRPFTQIPETDFQISAQMTQELLLLKPEKTRWPQSMPLLIIHGNKDTLVPYEDTQTYAHANDPHVKCEILDGVDHGFDDQIEYAMEITKEWLLSQ